MQQRTQATRLFSREQALQELDDLKFAVESIAKTLPPGGNERENAINASRGIAARLDYLHDSFARMTTDETP